MNILPNSFEPISLKRLASLNPYVSLPKSGAVDYVPMENIHQGYLDHQTEEISSLPSSLNAFSEGDILLAKVTPCFENGNIAIASNLLTGVGLCSTELFVLRIHSDKILPEYLMLLLQDDQFKKEAKSYMRGTGGLKRIPTDWLMSRKFLIPSLKHQRLIIQAMSSSDSLIQDIQKGFKETLDRLSSYRQSLITRAVTKGLDPNVEMKDSGYDIANNIPIHWVTIKLQYLCKLATGNQDTQDAVPDGQYPFYVRSPTIERTNHVTYSGTGILMAGDGVGAGKVFHYAEGQYGIHQRVYLLSEISDLIDPKYLFFYIKTIFSCEVERGTAKSTVPSIRMPMLTRFLVCVPPKREQIEIRDYCQKVEEKTEAISEDIKNNIHLLKEYRSSLISAAVTGQLAIDEEASA